MAVEKSFNQFLKCFLKTILEIMEDQPNYSVSIQIYLFLIIWHFVQITGYLYSDQMRPIQDQYQKLVTLIEYISTGTYLLYYKENNNLIIVIFYIMQAIMYFYFIYLGAITYMKLNNSQFLSQQKEKLSSINHFLNTFFILFQWVFFIPYFEINSGTIICGQQNFFVDQRDYNNCSLSLVQVIFSVIGNLLSIITSLIIIYFFRNYEFNERNMLKRKFHSLLIPQLFVYFLVIFTTLTNPLSYTFKYILLQVLVISMMYDLLCNLPFRNPKIIQVYAISIIFFEMTAIIYSYLMLYTSQQDNEMFYQTLIFGSLCSSVLLVSWYYRYEDVMKITEKNFDKMYKFLGFQLEEIFRLSQVAESDKFSRYKLQEIILFHQQQCTNLMCNCHDINICQSRKSIESEQILKIIQSIFEWSLKQQILQKDQKEYEHLSLKYISFIAKYQNNSVSAYYQLQNLLKQEQKKSFYFESICDILSKNIQQLIEERIQRESIIIQDFSGVNLRELFQSFSKQDQSTETLIPLLIKFIDDKIHFWNQVKDPSLTLQSLNQQVLILSEKCLNISQIFQSYFTSLNLSHWSSNVIGIKLYSIFKALVQNQLGVSRQFEQYESELLKKDSDKNMETLTNLNLIEGNILFILVSMSTKRGKIINTKKDKILNFFGYDMNDESLIENINQLMPNMFSKIHNQLMSNLILNGYSVLFNGNRLVFGLNKKGFIFPLKLQIDYLSNYQSDFVLNGCFLKHETSYQHIIIDVNGFIQGLTEEIFELLSDCQTSQEHLNELRNLVFSQKLNIFLIIPQFTEILENIINQQEKKIQTSIKNTNLNELYYQLNDIAFQSDKIYIKIPSHLTSLARDFNHSIRDFKWQFNSIDNSSPMQQSSAKANKPKDDLNIIQIYQQFKQFHIKNKSKWEYFNSKHLQISYKLEQKHLSLVEDEQKNPLSSKMYYVITLTILESKQFSNSPTSPKKLPLMKYINQKKIYQNTNSNEQQYFQSGEKIQLDDQAQSIYKKVSGNNSPTFGDAQFQENYQQKYLNKEEEQHFFKNQIKDLSNNNKQMPLQIQKKPIQFNEIDEQITFNKSLNLVQKQSLNNMADQEFKRHGDSTEFRDEKQNHQNKNDISYSNQFTIQKINFNQDINNLILSQNQLTILSPLSNQQSSLNLVQQQPQLNFHNFLVETDRIKDQQLTNRNDLNEFKKLLQEETTFQNKENPEKINSQIFQLSEPNLQKNIEDVEKNNIIPNQKISRLQKQKTILFQKMNLINLYKRNSKKVSDESSKDVNTQNRHSDVNNNLENQNNGKASLSSYQSSQKGFDNGILQVIVQKRNPTILRHFYLILDIRFFLFIMTIILISIVTINQINSIQKLIGDPLQVGQLFYYYTNLNLYTLKMYEMNLNILDNYVINEYYDNLSTSLKTLADNYQNSQSQSFNVLNNIRSQQNNPTVDTMVFSLGKPFTKRISIVEFFFKILNGVLQIQENPNNFNPIYLYQINANYFEYSAMIDSFMKTLFDSMNDQSFLLNREYVIFGSIILGYLLLILIFGIIIMNKISNYNEKILLLVSRLTVADIDKEVGMLQLCKSIFSNQQNTWKQVNFSNIISLSTDDTQKNSHDFNQLDHEFANNFSSQNFTHHEIFNSNHQNNIKSKLCNQNVDLNVHQNNHLQNLVDNTPKREILPTKATQSSERNYKTRQKNQSEISKFKSTSSNISSQIQGTKLKDWPSFLFFIFILLVSGIFFFVILILAYTISIQLQPSVDFMKNTSQFYTLMNKQVFMSEYIAAIPIMNIIDPNYPANYNQTQISDYEANIQNLSDIMNKILQDINNLKSVSSFSVQQFNDLFSQDACSFLQNENICDDNSSDLTQSQQFLRSAVSHGISSIVTSYQNLFKNVNYIIQLKDLEQQFSQMKDYLNNQLSVGQIFNAFSSPIKLVDQLFQQANHYCQSLINDNKNLVIIYYSTIGSVLICLQLIIDLILRNSMRKKLRKINLALSFIPISIAQEDITIQLLKSISKM
ncbi:transmembrane protein, putative (macronuclear) [Tetrahymena thermophila SB210]|uniref:Transmembrane protein, putative n=1 Tax=Tetrahymena thermophila (strain SB210) TaxID=312017 RepID=I7M826_TETTS|nr:transmembrane protein, putative [Tetrahymena thermophila SB210]EAR96483.3 transmembrane protein, putative [Tetrahymena thermophila SB210]|eukprot:XP_001016728.3 transmembrane protein, putative [Tetrahymena thermophila SB210]